LHENNENKGDRDMRKHRVSSLAVALVMVPFIMAAWAGNRLLAARYGSVTVPLTTTVAFEVTNGTENVLLGGIAVRADAASNAWTIAVIHNNFTNLIKSGTLTATSHTLLYEGNGSIPWAANARMRFTGTVNTNGALTTNIVQWSIWPQSIE
jgi:hypothetical protein